MPFMNGTTTNGVVPNLQRVLFVDAYDSFTNNIVSLLQDIVPGITIKVITIDLVPGRRSAGQTASRWTEAEFVNALPSYDAVVLGPGPGSPLVAEDVGIFQKIWALSEEQLLPVLGICLGFQSLVVNHGGSIRELRGGLHGMMRHIDYRDSDIFTAVQPFKATLYHSLGADVGQDQVSQGEWKTAKWRPFSATPELIPLAWLDEPREDGPERIMMAVKHESKPFWGLQYHPESICTESAAHRVIYNWFQQAAKWNSMKHRIPQSVPADQAHTDANISLIRSLDEMTCEAGDAASWTRSDSPLAVIGKSFTYYFESVPIPKDLDAIKIAEVLGMGGSETIILDASSFKNGDPLACHSIIALDVDTALRFEYYAEEKILLARLPGNELHTERVSLQSSGTREESVWHILSDFRDQRKVDIETQRGCPAFKGGFMGYTTYEMGLEMVSPGLRRKDHPYTMENVSQRPGRADLCMAWVTKSIVLDHKNNVAYIQELRPNPLTQANGKTCGGQFDSTTWLADVTSRISSIPSINDSPFDLHQSGTSTDFTDSKRRANELRRQCFKIPNEHRYEAAVIQCQNAIRKGLSYELCLTNQTTMSRPRGHDAPEHVQSLNGPSSKPVAISGYGTPWKMYKTLRSRQPAPFGSFLRLGAATLLSSSPERFMKVSGKGRVQMRPMKGTVRKSEAVVTVAQAEELLHVPKEIAENLMIVDLVRHDLHGICGAGRVTVEELMKVEEYATVFQMVTNVVGRLPNDDHSKDALQKEEEKDNRFGAFDVLAAVLPPGSMTGAPKKKSCELLYDIEQREPRGMYSGVVGYLDVAGQSDWSVTIRSIFRWDDETAPPEKGDSATREVWHIGAGGAVTALSTPQGEREEMFTKLAGPLGVLRDIA